MQDVVLWPSHSYEFLNKANMKDENYENAIQKWLCKIWIWRYEMTDEYYCVWKFIILWLLPHNRQYLWKGRMECIYEWNTNGNISHN